MLVEFFAPWCASCKGLYPKVSKLCGEHPKIVVVKVNFEENKELAKKMGVKVCGSCAIGLSVQELSSTLHDLLCAQGRRQERRTVASALCWCKPPSLGGTLRPRHGVVDCRSFPSFMRITAPWGA